MSNKSKRERIEAVRREQAARERKRQLFIGGAVVAAIVLIVGIGVLIQSTRDTSGEKAAAPEGATESYGLSIGDQDAPAEVVIHEDFLCPACAAFEAQTNEALAGLAEEGKVRVEYRPFDFLSRFGDYSARSTNAFAVVLDQAGPEAAKKFHDALFANQPSEEGPFHNDDWLVDQAVKAGATEGDVRGPIEDGEFDQWVVNATDQASKDNVTSTPTVLLDGEPVEGATLEEMATNLLAGIDAAQ